MRGVLKAAYRPLALIRKDVYTKVSIQIWFVFMKKQSQNKIILSRRQTGYSVYNEETKRRMKQNTLPHLYPELPNKKFDIIYADPPWNYNGKLQFDKSSKSVERINLSQKIFISSATFKYPTLKTSEMMKIPIHEISKEDCLLFMWTTNPHLSQAIELGRAWGFESNDSLCFKSR